MASNARNFSQARVVKFQLVCDTNGTLGSRVQSASTSDRNYAERNGLCKLCTDGLTRRPPHTRDAAYRRLICEPMVGRPSSGVAPVWISMRRHDVTRWVGRGRRMRGGIRRRPNHGTHCDTRRNATPVRSAVIAAVAAPASADVHVPIGIDVGVPIGTHVSVRADIRRVARVRRVAVEVVAVEVAAARGRPLTATAPATCSLLDQDHARRGLLRGYVYRSCHAGRRK